MIKTVMNFVDKKANQFCLLEEKETEFYYLVNFETMSVSYFGLTDSLYDLFEDMDAYESIYVEDSSAVTKWLMENEDDLDCDIYAIINHLVEIR